MSCFWGHNWKIVGYEHGTQVGNFSGKTLGDGTTVKKRCQKCGELEAEIRDGHWTAEELGLATHHKE